MKSKFYYQGHHMKAATAIKDYINSLDSFISPEIVSSPRAVGDALEFLIAKKFESFLGNWCSEYSSEFARRAMADMAFTDVEGIYSTVDVKTHRKDTHFNMPNLTSVERLARLYESDMNLFSLIMIKYSIEETDLIVSDVLFVPIEFLDWECLTVGALGWGQIQIANANNVQILPQNSRREWMLQLCNVMMGFYPREIEKITGRIQRFEEVKEYWEKKEDIWVK
ncbi:MAG: hypothetical protein OXI05_11665 [Bacteroidota bacterium]|nr:hypothetical protein [Bacteroidota bacterium]MDE2646475.1 hypothetical protein [Bacteroidota bacterium]